MCSVDFTAEDGTLNHTTTLRKKCAFRIPEPEFKNMKYIVEFEMRSDAHDAVSELVRKALVSAFGSVDKFSIRPCNEYVGHIQKDQHISWHEVDPNRDA